MPAEEAIPARLVIFSAMAAMLVVSLAVPEIFSEYGVLFGVAYFLVRFLQVALYALATVRTPETQHAILRLAPGFLCGPALLIVAGSLRLGTGCALDLGPYHRLRRAIRLRSSGLPHPSEALRGATRGNNHDCPW